MVLLCKDFEPNMLASFSLNPGSSKVTRFFACKCDATRAVSACLAALSPRRSTDTPDGVCVAHTFPASPAAGVTTTSVEVQAQSHLASNIATVAWLLMRGLQAAVRLTGWTGERASEHCAARPIFFLGSSQRILLEPICSM